jgi:hypothetical protein
VIDDRQEQPSFNVSAHGGKAANTLCFSNFSEYLFATGTNEEKNVYSLLFIILSFFLVCLFI